MLTSDFRGIACIKLAKRKSGAPDAGLRIAV